MLRQMMRAQIAWAAHMHAIIAALILAAMCFAASSARSQESPPSMMQTTSIAPAEKDTHAPAALKFGVYDPHDHFRASNDPRIEHVFVYWQELDKQMLQAKMRLAHRMGRTLMITVEPYTKAENWRDGGERLFNDIAAGRFDGEIAASCGMIADFPGEQWVRWGHEMEDPTDRYPWARNDPGGYVAAYRKFVDTCRKIAPQARFVWSPKGEPGLEAYYPGSAHVDMVGLSVWGLEKWDLDRHGRPRGFSETFRKKYRRVEQFGKPVIIAELGVAGREAYRQSWISEILATTARRSLFPLLTSVVYFNDKEPHYWTNGYGSPDWRLPVSALAGAQPLHVSSR